MNVLETKKALVQGADGNDFKIKKILVAVDLSPHSEKTAAFAAKFAKSVEASITLVHVFPPEPVTGFSSESIYESFERSRQRTAQKLTKLVQQVRKTGVKCDDNIRVGEPAEEVTLAAKILDADLIITATHHPGFLGRLLGLDQAPRILHRADCPVLVYHEGNE
jgi:nucleotide-binding universal stress UspA family protein